MDKNYIGVGDKAKKISKWYVSRGGVVKNVVKGYIGVNNIAKPLFERKYELSYYGTVEDLNNADRIYYATSVGNYALFGTNSYRYIVETYDNNLIKGSAEKYDSPYKLSHQPITVGNYALFNLYNNNKVTKMQTYDINLVKGSTTGLTDYLIQNSTTVGNYALFAHTKTIETYDNNLVKGTATNLSVERYQHGATSVGNYALFGGGYYGTVSWGPNYYRTTVDTYDNNLVKGTASNLSKDRCPIGGKVGNYALFAGGCYYYNKSYYANYSEVDTYDNNLVKGTAPNLSVARTPIGGKVGNYALFAGGVYMKVNTTNNTHSYPVSDVVDTYDNNLVKGLATSLSRAKTNVAATTVGNYALFGGGDDNSSNYSTVVDVYQIKLT